MTVLDASAVLAYLQGEPGGERVEKDLSSSVISAANLCEVLSKFDGAAEARLVQAVLNAQGVGIEPVGSDDSWHASRLRVTQPSLSLGDRLCIALGMRRNEPVMTADRAWGESDRIIQIR